MVKVNNSQFSSKYLTHKSVVSCNSIFMKSDSSSKLVIFRLIKLLFIKHFLKVCSKKEKDSLIVSWLLVECSKRGGKASLCKSLPFLDIEIGREDGQFVTSVYCKPKFSQFLMVYKSFVPKSFKFVLIFPLLHIDFKLCKISSFFTKNWII